MFVFGANFLSRFFVPSGFGMKNQPQKSVLCVIGITNTVLTADSDAQRRQSCLSFISSLTAEPRLMSSNVSTQP